VEFKKKQQEDAKVRKELAAKAAKGGPLLGGGIKKSPHPLSSYETLIFVDLERNKFGGVYEGAFSGFCRRRLIIYISPSLSHRSGAFAPSLLYHSTSTR